VFSLQGLSENPELQVGMHNALNSKSIVLLKKDTTDTIRIGIKLTRLSDLSSCLPS
jgi:hypothetical protein